MNVKWILKMIDLHGDPDMILHLHQSLGLSSMK